MIYIPKKSLLIKTNPEDPLDYYYNPFTSWFYRKRLKMAQQFLKEEQVGRILDIGYGCGLLMPELSRHADEVHGLDTHDKAAEVKAILGNLQVFPELVKGSIYELPYETGFFDIVVSISVMEHIKHLEKAFKEMKRITKENGICILGFPVKNRITKMLFKALDFNSDENHVSSHSMIIDSFKGYYHITGMNRFPGWINRDYALYITVRGVNR
ncbi:MAG: class I SAM-dependent methyltransferase [Elusimicrobiota bacterium]